MSHRSNRIKEIWKDVEAELRRTWPVRNGIRLSHPNAETYWDSISLLFLCWYDILKSFHGEPPHRLITEWPKAISVKSVEEVVGIMKEADNLLLLSIADKQLRSYDRFKHDLCLLYPSAGAIIGPAKGLFAAWNEDSISAFASLHQLFAFIGRLSLRDLSDLEDNAIDTYVTTDQNLQDASFSDPEAKIIATWFPRNCRYKLYDSWVPRHGPGAVADCEKTLAAKYQHLGFDTRARYLLNKLPEMGLPRVSCPSERRSRLVCVPKTATRLRTICAEPASLQWIQQGFFKSLDEYFHTHPYLRRRIDLHDQETSRDMAWEGSIGGNFSTIDLSNASDSVSNSLARCWFDHSALREVLFACRSTEVSLRSGQTYQQRKYAPMGSSLCFPIECIVFSAVVEAAIRESGGNPIASSYRVFGDDIVVETEYAQAVIDELVRVGFSVNTSKSYYNPDGFFFREACGGEYLCGRDVAPIRISRKFSSYRDLVRHPSRIQNLITCANDCNQSLPSVRRRIIEALNGLPPDRRVPFDRTGENGLFSPNPTNWHLRQRYDSNYQAVVYSVGHSKHLTWNAPEDEDIRLYEYLRVVEGREEEGRGTWYHDLFDSPLVVCVSTRGKYKWLPKWDPLYYPD